MGCRPLPAVQTTICQFDTNMYIMYNCEKCTTAILMYKIIHKLLKLLDINVIHTLSSKQYTTSTFCDVFVVLLFMNFHLVQGFVSEDMISAVIPSSRHTSHVSGLSNTCNGTSNAVVHSCLQAAVQSIGIPYACRCLDQELM